MTFDELIEIARKESDNVKRDKGTLFEKIVQIYLKNEATGELTAIQAKFYDNKIYKKHIDSFLAEPGKSYYSEGIIVYSLDSLSINTDEAINQLSKPVAQIGLSDLRNSRIEWESFIPSSSNEVKVKNAKKLDHIKMKRLI
ncbi:hypothetical protein [Enterococcus hailinensis]|uniref:restriction endonuclease n=1 Tax=Enterococcus hailinensis TaxID=3238988 RepID=UPI0038B3D9F6